MAKLLLSVREKGQADLWSPRSMLGSPGFIALASEAKPPVTSAVAGSFL